MLSKSGLSRNLREGRFKSGPFLYCKYECGIFIVIITEHNIKQNIYTDTEVISVIPRYLLYLSAVYKNIKSDNVLINKQTINKICSFNNSYFVSGGVVIST